MDHATNTNNSQYGSCYSMSHKIDHATKCNAHSIDKATTNNSYSMDHAQTNVTQHAKTINSYTTDHATWGDPKKQDFFMSD